MEWEQTTVKSPEEEEDEKFVGIIREEDSESSSEDEDDDESDETDDEEDEPVDEDILIEGIRYTNEELLEMRLYPFDKDLKITNKLLNKVRRYLKSISETHGFDIDDWPGYIWGITPIEPRSKQVIGKRHRHPEGYNFTMIIADKAIQVYNKDHDTNYKVESIEKVNSRMIKGTYYYITFAAFLVNSNDKRSFQALVYNNSIDCEIEVCSCNIKPGCGTCQSTVSAPMVVKPLKPVLDDKSIIGSKRNWSDEHLWELIEADNRNQNRRRGHKNKDKFLIKVRCYLESIETSEGFECSEFPGRISGLTTVEPRDDVIHMMNYRPECYDCLCYFGCEAIKVYNQKNGTQFCFSRVDDVNWLSVDDSPTFYYITFVARSLDYIEFTFQAKVYGDMPDWKIEFCRLEPKA